MVAHIVRFNKISLSKTALIHSLCSISLNCLTPLHSFHLYLMKRDMLNSHLMQRNYKGENNDLHFQKYYLSFLFTLLQFNNA